MENFNYSKLHEIVERIQSRRKILRSAIGYIDRIFWNRIISQSEKDRLSMRSFIFDIGVTKALNNGLTIPTVPGTIQYGDAFEQFYIFGVHSFE